MTILWTLGKASTSWIPQAGVFDQQMPQLRGPSNHCNMVAISISFPCVSNTKVCPRTNNCGNLTHFVYANRIKATLMAGK